MPPKQPAIEPPTQPPRFRDASGREWSIKLTLGVIESIQEQAGVDVLPRDCDVSTLTGLLFDPRQLAKVLWAAIQSKDGSTWEEFRDALDGEALSLGWNALVEAVLFFIRSQSEPLAKTVEEAIEASMRLMERGTEAIRRTMASAEIEDRYVASVESELASTFAGSVGS